MKFNEERIKALECALGPDFFRVVGKVLDTKMQKVERECRDRELKLKIAYANRPRVPCALIVRTRTR